MNTNNTKIVDKSKRVFFSPQSVRRIGRTKETLRCTELFLLIIFLCESPCVLVRPIRRTDDEEVTNAGFADQIIRGSRILKPYCDFLNYVFFDEKEESITL